MNATRVLLVDDDPAIQRMLAFALALEGYEILTASDGLEATDVARANRPDVILMDVMLPEMTGLEATCVLRRSRDTADIPILVLTALGGDQDVWSGWRAGADSYLTKPIDLELLLSEIDRVTSPEVL